MRNADFSYENEQEVAGTGGPGPDAVLSRATHTTPVLRETFGGDVSDSNGPSESARSAALPTLLPICSFVAGRWLVLRRAR